MSLDEYDRLIAARDDWWRQACALSERVGFLEAALRDLAAGEGDAATQLAAYERQYGRQDASESLEASI